MDLNGWRHKRRRAMRNFRWWVRDHGPVLRVAAYTLGIATITLTAIQIFYPANRVLPLVRVGGERVGGSSLEVAGGQVAAMFDAATLDIGTARRHFRQPMVDAGVRINAAATAKMAASYPFWQRILPFSSVCIALHRNTAPVAIIDKAKLQALANRIATEGAVPAVDATIAADGGTATLVPAQPSKNYPASRTVAVLQALRYRPRTSVTLAPRLTRANRTDDEVRTHLAAAQRAIDTPLTLTFDSQVVRPGKKDIAAWVTFKEVAPAYDLAIEFKRPAIDAYLQSAEQKIYKAPGETKIHTIDDREVDRSTGESGYGVVLDKAYAAVSDAIRRGKKETLSLATGKIDPTVAYDRQYSNTDQRLVSLVGGVEAAHSGYGIAVMRLDGPSVNVNGNKQFETASTYKLFVAYAVLKAVDNGRLHWTDSIAGGRSASKCLEDMIVISDNDCPVAFTTKLGGWAVVQDEMHDLGLSSKTRLVGATKLSTANDLSYFLYRLQNGTLLNGTDTDLLLGYMRRQVYRNGIPAGTGLPVADKVGFVDNVIHDAGIVYPKTGKPYVLVIMTTSTWAGIADAAKQINAGL